MASGAIVSGLDRLVQAVEAAEAASAAAAARQAPRHVPGGFMCPHPACHRVFSKRYNQQAHMRLHDGTRPFSCQLCGKAFMWKSSLKSHAKMHAKLSAANANKQAKNKLAVKSMALKKKTNHHASADTGVAISSKGKKMVLQLDAQPGGRQSYVKKSSSGGSKSPSCISMVDHDAATVLATFR